MDVNIYGDPKILTWNKQYTSKFDMSCFNYLLTDNLTAEKHIHECW